MNTQPISSRLNARNLLITLFLIGVTVGYGLGIQIGIPNTGNDTIGTNASHDNNSSNVTNTFDLNESRVMACLPPSNTSQVEDNESNMCEP